MTKCYSKFKSLIFEELEPRLLFSADGAEVLAAEAVEQEVQEQPVIIIQEQFGNEADENVAENTNSPDSQQDPAGEETNEASEENNPVEETEDLGEEAREDSSQTTAPQTEGNLEGQVDEEAENKRSELVLVNDDVKDLESLVESIGWAFVMIALVMMFQSPFFRNSRFHSSRLKKPIVGRTERSAVPAFQC